MPMFTQGVKRLRASDFGISSANADNAAGFALISSWMMSAAEAFGDFTKEVEVEFPPGRYLASSIKIDLTRKTTGTYSPQCKFIGAGTHNVTVFQSTASSTEPVFFEIQAGAALSVTLSNLTVVARDDVAQDALHFVASRRSLDNTGGLTNPVFDNLKVISTLGHAVVFLGGDDNLAPHQFVTLNNCLFTSHRRSALLTYGQFGQVTMTNGYCSGGSLETSAAAGIVMSADQRLTLQASAVDTAANTITGLGEKPPGAAVRFVGTNLPSGVSTGATYYLRRHALSTASEYNKHTVHSSLPNLASNTKVVLGSTGTLVNWWVTELFLLSVGSNVLNFPIPHLLVDQQAVQFVGTNLPTGVIAATDYWVIRNSAVQIRLASSKANAAEGTAITFSGGNVERFGLSRSSGADNSAYGVNIRGVSCGYNLCGVYLNSCNDVQMTPFVEIAKNAIFIHNSQVTIHGGTFRLAADDGGNGLLLGISNVNSRVSVSGLPFIAGGADKVVNNTGGAYYSGDDGWVGLESTTTSLSSNLVYDIFAAATLDTRGYSFLYVYTSTTAIRTIQSSLPPRAQLKLVAWGGPITFNVGGNLGLPGNTAVTIPDRATAVFERVDTIAGWQLVSTSAGSRRTAYTVATLPADPPLGLECNVTDATTPAWNTSLTGGGAVFCGARWNGSNWVAF